MMWVYGVKIEADGGDFVVSVRDLPEVVTSGDTREQAIELAADAIVVAVAGRIEDEMELPAPTPVQDGETPVPLDPHMAAKASVFVLWKRSGLSKRELARRLGRKETEARRILDPRFGTKLDQLGAAARALGGSIVVSLG